MVLGTGGDGERDPHNHQGGGHGVGACWKRAGCHSQAGHPCPHRGTALRGGEGDVTPQPLPGGWGGHPPSSTPVPLRHPSRLAFARSGAGALGQTSRSCNNCHMQKPFPETNNLPRGNRRAGVRPPQEEGGPPHLRRPPRLWERTAERAPSSQP